jgi:hypothetical protein
VPDHPAVITTNSQIRNEAESPPPPPPPLGLRFRFDPISAKVSLPRLESDVCKVRLWAERLGVSAGRFARIVVASGATLGHRRARFSNALVVFVPKGSRNRANIRREVHRATATAMLDGLRSENPALYAAVAARMDASFRETNRLLLSVLSSEEKASKLRLSLQIYFFGYIRPPRGRLREEPGRLGIVGYGDANRRRSWEEETASILAEVQGKGWDKVIEAQAKDRRNALRAEKAAMRRYLETRSLFDRFTGKRRMMRKRLVQAGEARALCEEAERKTAFLRGVLRADGSG